MAGQPEMIPLTKPTLAVAMFAARLAAVPTASAVHGSQPDRRSARRSASSDQGRDDLDSIDGQGEGVSMPARVAVRGGELAHVAVADRSGDADQPGDRHAGGAPDPPVGPVRGRNRGAPRGGRAVHRRSLTARDLRKRTESGSPANRTLWFASWYEDIRFLVKHLNLATAEEALRLCAEIFPDEEISERARLVLEDAFGDR
jgi:hypothetical protein